MRAIVFDKTLHYVADCQRPAPREGEALIRVTACGICNTDLEIVKGYGGFAGVLGHEFCGVVESAGPLHGRRVVGEINLKCHDCRYCTQGMGNHCPNRTVLGIVGKDGAMADYLTLPLENLHEIPASLADEQAVFVEPLAAAFRIIEQLRPEPSTRVLVMGDGKLGLLCALVLKLYCPDVTLVGKHGEKMALVAGLGIETMAQDVVKPAFDLVVEASGSEKGLGQALELVRPTGTVVLKSTTAEPSSLNLFPVVVNEISVVGSRCGPFGPAIETLASGRIDVQPLITASYPVEQAVAAFEHAGRPGALKVLLTFGV